MYMKYPFLLSQILYIVCTYAVLINVETYGWLTSETPKSSSSPPDTMYVGIRETTWYYRDIL